MNASKRYTLSIILSIALLLLLVLLISLDALLEAAPPATLTMREIQVAAPPPPPPPPMQNKASATDPVVDLAVSSIESPVALLEMDIDIAIPTGELFGTGSGDFQQDLSIDWQGFDLAQLDAAPTLINSPVLTYPDRSLLRGIKTFEVKLHILIDESGQAYLIRVIENPHPIFKKNIESYVSRVRFTPPTMSGISVKAEFMWPVRIQLL